MSNPPLIAHIIHRLGTGGMENGLVNLINHMPRERYRHAIVCLQGYTEFRQRIRRDDVEIYDVDKRDGHDLGAYRRLYRILRELKPAILHTRNLSALESQAIGAAARIKGRVHGEHGRDIYDLHGKNRKYNLLRRAIQPLVGRYITVSRDLAQWLVKTVRVPARKVTQIYNGVDSEKFHPRQAPRAAIGPAGFSDDAEIVFGSIGRLAEVKDFPTLIRAFDQVCRAAPDRRLRLVIVGDGPTRAQCEALVAALRLGDRIWLAGDRSDVPDLLRAFDVFILPSLGEGISNTILEAMASGLPVIATAVGGNPELVAPGVTGALIPPAQPDAMARALLGYVTDAERIRREGLAARAEIEARFSMEAMVRGYLGVYDTLAR